MVLAVVSGLGLLAYLGQPSKKGGRLASPNARWAPIDPVAAPGTTVQASPAGDVAFFSVGSSKQEVLAVQGTPTELSDRMWKYGSSAVYFSNGVVTNWESSSLNPLKALVIARPLPAGLRARPYFTVGSSQKEVLAVQGTPTERSGRVWKCGLSTIYFSNGVVANWESSSLNPSRPGSSISRFRQGLLLEAIDRA